MTSVNEINAVMREKARIRNAVVKLPSKQYGGGGDMVGLGDVLEIIRGEVKKEKNMGCKNTKRGHSKRVEKVLSLDHLVEKQLAAIVTFVKLCEESGTELDDSHILAMQAGYGAALLVVGIDIAEVKKIDEITTDMLERSSKGECICGQCK